MGFFYLENLMNKLPIETPNPLFGLYKYPFAKEIMEEQQDATWTAQEIPVENDIHDFRSTMNPEQLNVSTVTLQSFVEVEQTVGNVWSKIASWFPHSEIEGACTEIERMEKSVHAFFYQKMSDEMRIDPEETAKNQQTIQSLKKKLEFIKEITSNLDADKVLSLATVAMLEQVLLFSNFAMLKSFKSNGYNLMKSTLVGVDYVIRDEQLHGDFAGYLFNTYQNEEMKASWAVDYPRRETKILDVMQEIIRHEDAMIDYTFPGQIAINDITGEQLKIFIRSRANDTLELLGYKPFYEVTVNPIAEWFYRGTKSIKSHDFFASDTTQYNRTWKIQNFSRLPYVKSTKEVIDE